MQCSAYSGNFDVPVLLDLDFLVLNKIFILLVFIQRIIERTSSLFQLKHYRHVCDAPLIADALISIHLPAV